jgi:hypothetical protein
MLPMYQDVVRKPNILKNRNPLKNTIATVISLGSRLTDLNTSKEWKALVKEHKATAILLDPNLRPKVMMVKLGKLIIDEDIQRALDVKHCAKKIAAVATFDPRLLQVVYCVKTPGKDEFCAVDGQHTAATIAGLVDAGLFAGETDWREVEVAVLYVETTSKAFARKAFALINGKGKKKVSPWYEHRTKVMSVRIDGSTDDEDEFAEQQQQICEKYDCYPIDLDSQFVGRPGTFTHISSALNLDAETLELCCKFHDKYFHYDAIDGSLWFMMADIAKAFNAAKIKITDKFLGELAGILQGYFAGLYQFHQSVKGAHLRWGEHTYGYKVSWDDDSIAAVLVMLYRNLGGTQRIPQPMLDRFAQILDFVDDDIKELYNDPELLAA